MLLLLIRPVVTRVFAAISRGDYQAAIRGLAHDVHHVFPGRHPLGGTRHSREAVRLWFERLGRLFPGHEFTVHRVAVTGWPWRLSVAVQWTAHLTPEDGQAYLNEGAHWITISWFRVTAFHAYLDTSLVEQACLYMAQAGIAEAAAEPITGP